MWGLVALESLGGVKGTHVAEIVVNGKEWQEVIRLLSTFYLILCYQIIQSDIGCTSSICLSTWAQ